VSYQEDQEVSPGKIILSIVLGIVAIWMWFATFVTVGAGEQAVITRFGAIKSNTMSPGIHVIVPIVDRAHIFSTRQDKIEVEAEAASRDLQSVKTKIALNYHLNPAKVNNLYQEVGKDYDERVIQPAIQESIKASTSQFSAEELITKRPEVKEVMMKALKIRLEKRYIMVDDVAIVNFTFSKAFDDSIEAKQVAEQNALKAKQDLERVRTEAEQKVAQAEAEAASLRAQKSEITPELLQLRTIEMQTKYADKWDGKLPSTMVPGATVPFLNIK
jgi:regulator of protease activity HflC (stomatin/prohibitin superfamily)